jgi:hypothetical protein
MSLTVKKMSWADLRQLINTHFDMEELRTLCFDLNVDFDSLRGEGKEAKVRELVAYSKRSGRTDELMVALNQRYPNAPWSELELDDETVLHRAIDGRRLWFLVGGTIITLGAIVALGFLITTLSGETTGSGLAQLIVQIWDVEQDEKHAVVASQQFTDIAGSSLSEEELQRIGNWFVEQVRRHYGRDAEQLLIRVHVPADLRNERLDIEVTPAGSYEAYFWSITDGRKSRIAVTASGEQVLAELGEDFFLEISRPGYESQTVRVEWGQQLDQSFVVEPSPIRIGIEEFEGEDNFVATQLIDYLLADPRFTIKDPGTLEKLRAKIAEEKALIEKNPEVQIPIRTSLGVDLIISGRFGVP